MLSTANPQWASPFPLDAVRWVLAARALDLYMARMPAGGVRISLLDAAEIPSVVGWLDNPNVSGPMLVKSPVCAADIAAGRLTVWDGDDVEVTGARFLSIYWSGELVGFCIDYGWDLESDPMRELDLALPGPHPRTARFLIRVMAAVVHFEFSQLGARTIRVAAPVRDPALLDALYARLGGRFLGELQAKRPDTGRPETRRIYGLERADFYAGPKSRFAGLEPF